jgi:hypothetical protein
MYLENFQTVDQGVKINCNTGVIRTNQVGDYGSISARFIPEGILNISLMNKLEKRYQITQDSWKRYYVLYTARSLQKEEQRCWCRQAPKRQQTRLCRLLGRTMRDTPIKRFLKQRTQDALWG